MTKGLEAFKFLCRCFVKEINKTNNKLIEDDYFYNERYSVSLYDDKTDKIYNIADIMKELKALEIIKETPIFAYYVTIYKDAYEMVSDAKGFRVNNSVEELKEMFDLLKEVLL